MTIKSGMILLFSVMCITGNALAQDRRNPPNPTELASLPQYCQDRLSVNRERMKYWGRVMGGENSLHLHHHCNGLLFFMQANTVFGDDRRRKYLLQRASAESSYVLKRWDPSFPIYQEALNNKLQADAMLGR